MSLQSQLKKFHNVNAFNGVATFNGPAAFEDVVSFSSDVKPPANKKLKLCVNRNGDYTTTFDSVNPTSNRVITFPDRSFTVSNLSSDMEFDSDVNVNGKRILGLPSGNATNPGIVFDTGFLNVGIAASDTVIRICGGGMTLGAFSPYGLELFYNGFPSTGGYYLEGQKVLNTTTLGDTVTDSSLTKVGALTSGSIASGFGTITTHYPITGSSFYAGVGAKVLDMTSLGTTVTDSSLTKVGALTNGSIASGFGAITTTNSITGADFYVSTNKVLDGTTLGTNVVNSSLTKVGALTNGSIASGFGPIAITNDINCANITCSSNVYGQCGYFNKTPNSSSSNANVQFFLGETTLSGGVKTQLQLKGHNNSVSQAWEIGTGGGWNESDANIQRLWFKESGTTEIEFTVNGINLVTGNSYSINNTAVLSATALGTGITTSSLTDLGHLNNLYLKKTNITNTNSPYTVVSTDNVIMCSTSGGAITINLPAASGQNERTIRIKDKGNAATNNITIDANGSETIDGALTKVINTNYGSVTLYCDGTSWFLL
jgi:hypothetical protein